MTEQQAKELVLGTIDLAAKFVALTSTGVDDKVVAMVRTAVANEMLWGWMWSLLQRFLDTDDPIIVSAECPEPAAAAELGINPLMIIALIKAIADIIKLLRNRD